MVIAALNRGPDKLNVIVDALRSDRLDGCEAETLNEEGSARMFFMRDVTSSFLTLVITLLILSYYRMHAASSTHYCCC